MKVLLVHNYYRSGTPGGEDVVFEQERDLLLESGHEVYCYTRSNDEMDEGSAADRLRVLSGMQRSGRTVRELRAAIRSFRPDVAHFHNTFPLISASGYEICHSECVPVVQTVHNFRIACSAATHFQDGRICELCTPINPWAAVRHRCYRGSAPASLAVATMLFRNHLSKVHRRRVSKFIALTQFAANRLRLAGIPADRLVVKPNFVADVLADHPDETRGDAVVYAGRLSAEKGVQFLLQAWAGLGDVQLIIVGDGPLKDSLQAQARRMSLPVEFRGAVARKDVSTIFRRARAVVVPSLCFEGGVPLALLEAMATATPVIASRIGGIPDLVEHGKDGLLFEPSDADGLVAAARRCLANRALSMQMAFSGRDKVRRHHGREANLQALLAIYRSVIEA